MFPELFSFTRANEFVKAIYFYELKKSPKMTLQQFAKRFGIASHSVIHNFINGKRPLTEKFIEALFERYKFDGGRKFYLKSLVALDRKPELRNDSKFMSELEAARPVRFHEKTETVIDPDIFQDGLLGICLALQHIKDFSIEKACDLLEGQFSKEEVMSAYERLKMIAIPVKDPDYKHRYIYQFDTTTVKSAPWVKWFKEYLARMHTNPVRVVEDSWWSGFFMCVDDSLKEDIRKFITSKNDEFVRKFSAQKGTSENLSYVLYTIQRVTKKL